MTLFIISQICGYLGTASAVIGFQAKRRETLLISQIASNLFIALSFIFIGRPTGGLICVIAMIQTIVNFCLSNREKNPTWWVNTAFILMYIAASVYSWTTAEAFHFVEIIPLLCALLFFLAITLTQGLKIRLCFVSNATLWIIYDLFGTLSVANLVTHILILASSLISVIRYDIIGKNKKD